MKGKIFMSKSLFDSYFNQLNEEYKIEQERIETEDKLFEESLDYLNERSIVKMDKASMKKRLLNQAILQAAKEANDPLYKKYVKATAIRKSCRETLRQKYNAKGKEKMREYLKRRKETTTTKSNDK